ncbi:MAG: hypothetical protein GIX03_07220 [Candidatus Eremiobacteraeota bacterium]|nr:hypothetical protein [Candidatus Eremiobacteraeota bacterium]
MRSWDEVERLGVAFSIEHWQAGMADQKVVRQWIATNIIPLSEIRTEWKNEKSLSFASVGKLWRRPVVQVEEDLYFVPIPALIENAMGDGTYFVLLSGFANDAAPEPDARKKAVLKFTSLYGEFFEDHVSGILERAYSNRRDARITREILQDGDKSTDIIIAEGKDLIFVEIVSKRMNLRDSVVRLKPESIAKDIEDGVLHKAQQIDNNIRKFRKGELLPDWPRLDGQRFFPVIVAPHDRPRVNVTTEHLTKRQHGDGPLAGAEPLELLDLGEIEQLENGLAAGIRFRGSSTARIARRRRIVCYRSTTTCTTWSQAPCPRDIADAPTRFQCRQENHGACRYLGRASSARTGGDLTSDKAALTNALSGARRLGM